MNVYTFTRKRLFALLAIVAVLGGIIGLSACSGSSGPQNATQVLQSDGYTPNAALTQSLQSGIGASDSMVTSSQVGENNSGSVQAVIVFDNASDEQLGATSIQAAGYTGNGINVVSNGDTLTATGPLSAWAAAGSDG
jgi:hypothetical protein